MSQLKRRAVAVVTGISLALAGMFIAASPAQAASGRVSCSTSQVVGVWIHVDGGTSGWAVRNQTSDPKINNWSYNTQNKRWKADVGCGGSPSNWGQTVRSDWSNRQGSADITCADAGYIRTCRIG